MAGPERFDAIVVGSGFGGSVTAYRLASAGQRVLVLERGRAYPPGSFPRTPHGLKDNFWSPGDGLQGMFDLWAFTDLDGVVCSGLGGGSLIYANVLLRKDEKWFVREDRTGGGYESWPVTREQLDPHYDDVERMLNAQRYPLEQSPYDQTAKTLALRDAAAALDLDWFLPNLAVTFANEGDPALTGEPIREQRPNLHGRTRQTCRLCGECDIGCNYGSKNTLDYNYLTAAQYAGAEIRTLSEVRELGPLQGGGYEAHYVVHDPETRGRKTDVDALPRTTVQADKLILSAGTFGSTYLLLRNRGAFPALSPCLGEGFCGNGDLLTFAVRARHGDGSPRYVDAARGPVITSTIRVADEHDGEGGEGRGFYLQDAGVPEFATWMLQFADEPHALLRAAPAVAGLVMKMLEHKGEHLGVPVSRLFGDCGLSAGTLPLLGMGRDAPDGVMRLEHDLLEVKWSKDAGSRGYFDRVRELSHRISDELGGHFMDNPLWWSDRVITVHPLGGARMGLTDQQGVVNEWGEVHNYPGLHIADGSVMPGPVGANPSLTIAALADRFCDRMLDPAVTTTTRRAPRTLGEHGGAQPPAEPVAALGATAASLAFTEDMKGFCSLTETDYERAFRAGRKAGNALDFHLTIETDDIERFVADATHEAIATGWVRAEQFGGRLEVQRGRFNLFVDQDGDRAHKRMFYRLFFADPAGHPLTLVGFKDVVDGPGLDVWRDTSTLYTRLLAGHVETDAEAGAELVATGILHIHLLDFARQMTTFRVHPASRVDALARFGVLFAGDLWDVYRPGAEARG